MSSPVSRTLEQLRSDGYTVAIVERWIPRGLKLDLFGLADIEALADSHTLYVQVCRDTDLTDHRRKHLAEPRLAKLIACPSRVFEVWSWAKRGRAWSPRRLRAELSDSGRVGFVGVTPARSLETPMGTQ